MNLFNIFEVKELYILNFILKIPNNEMEKHNLYRQDIEFKILFKVDRNQS